VSFLQWTFLFGAVAVVGPIVAHLLAKPRFRRIPFTMLRFLRSGQQESHSRRKLRDVLVLLLRCTIIVLLAVLFARPVVRVRAAPQKQRALYHLALDDSVSLAYRDGTTSLHERMIGAALDHVARAPEEAQFSLFGLASGRTVPGLSRRQAVGEIKRWALVPKSARLDDFLPALRQADRAAQPGDTLWAVLLSDFTPNVLRQFERIREGSRVDELRYEALVPTGPVSNAAIVEARVTGTADNQLSLDVTVANWGETRQQRELSVAAPDVKGTAVKLDLAPQQRRVVRMQMDAGPALARSGGACLPVELTLTPGDNLAADDAYRVAVYVPGATTTNVLVVHRGEETFLFETALQALAGHGAAKGLSLKKVRESRLAAADLDWADVAVFASIPGELSCPVTAFKSHLAAGGSLVFFATESANRQIAERLLHDGLLPGIPEKWVQGAMYPEPQPGTSECPGLSEPTARSLLNYRFDKVALKGYWSCRVPPDAECVWQLTNGAGFLYHKAVERGSSILVNTSIDDSLGLLAKSHAWVAFCRFLIGETSEVRQFCFHTEERPILNLPDALRLAQQTSLGIENCDGSRARAAGAGTRLLLPAPVGVGWMKTVSEPTLYAAVNLPGDETEVSKPAEATVAAAMKRAFVSGADRRQVAVQAGVKSQDKPLWPVFAWAAILLLLLEPAITNRLKR
jgi:hypothetical protein